MEEQNNIKITFMERIRYELYNLSESSSNIKTWIVVLSFLAIISAIFKSWPFFFLSTIFLLYLISEKHVQSGKVRNFLRKEKQIPNKTEIRKIKELPFQEENRYE